MSESCKGFMLHHGNSKRFCDSYNLAAGLFLIPQIRFTIRIFVAALTLQVIKVEKDKMMNL